MNERNNQPSKEELEAALRNFELYHTKRPLDGFRIYMGLPPVTPEQFKADIELEQGKIVEIARAQKQEWEDSE